MIEQVFTDEVVTLINARRQVLTPDRALDRSGGKSQKHLSLGHVTLGPTDAAGTWRGHGSHQGKTHHWWNCHHFEGAQSMLTEGADKHKINYLRFLQS